MSQIPKLLHYVWVGGSPLPQRLEKYLSTWRLHNPDYRLVLWDEDKIDFSNDFIRRAYEQKAWAKLSDYVRLQAVWLHGGIYMDTDVEVVRPLDPLLQYDCFIGHQSSNPDHDPLCNAVLGAIPGHWFPRAVLDIFPETCLGLVNDIGTGPELVSQIFLDRGLPRQLEDTIVLDGVAILPARAFYPYLWTEEFSPRCVTADTFGIHHWDMSWHYHDAWWPVREVRRQIKSYPTAHRMLRRFVRQLRRTIVATRS